MAFSGLGSGTIGDPYQITTLVQLKEAGGSINTTNFYKLMNDLDCVGVTASYSNQCDLYGELDGNNFSMLNVDYSYYYFWIKINTTCTLKNLTIYGGLSTYTSSRSIFDTSSGSSLSNVLFDNIKIYVPIPGKSTLNMFGNFSWDSTCIVSNCVFEGYFNYFFQSTFGGTFIHNKVNWLYNNRLTQFFLFNTFTAATVITANIFNLPILMSGYMWFGYNSVIPGMTISQNLFIIGSIVSQVYSFGIGPSLSGLGNVFINNNKFVYKYVVSTTASYSYVLGYYGSANHYNNFFSGDFYRPTQADKCVFTRSGAVVLNNYFRRSKFTSVPLPATGQQSLTDNECLVSSNFVNFDFDNIWQMGTEEPELRTIPENTFALTTSFITSKIIRLSGTSFSCELFMSDKNLSFSAKILTSNGTLITFVQNTVSFIVTVPKKDDIFTIELKNGSDTIINTENYTHYCNDIIYSTPVSVISLTNVILNDGVNVTNYAKGRFAKVGDYIYMLSSYGTGYSSFIIKSKINVYDDFTITQIYANNVLGKITLIDLIRFGDYLWAISSSYNGSGCYIYKINPTDLSYIRWILPIGNSGTNRIETDGIKIYVIANDEGSSSGFKIYVVDPVRAVSGTQYNNGIPTGTITLPPVGVTFGSISVAAAIFVDNTYVYLPLGSIIDNFIYFLKINKTTGVGTCVKASISSNSLNFSLNGAATESTDYVFVYWGVVLHVFSKSTGLEVGQLQILTDSRKMTSYIQVQDNYLFVFDPYGIIALDIRNANTWRLNSNIGEFTTSMFSLKNISNNTVTVQNFPPNFYNISDNVFLCTYSSPVTLLKFTLPGIVISKPPTIETSTSISNSSNSIKFRGRVLDNGMVIPNRYAIQYGQNSLLSDLIEVSATLNGEYFEAIVSNLTLGTLYYRAVAENTKGIGYGAINQTTVMEYYQPTPPTNEATMSSSFAVISWGNPLSIGGGTFIGYKIERSLDGLIWETVQGLYQEMSYHEAITLKTYYRISAVTLEYGQGQLSDVGIAEPMSGKVYKLYIGSTELHNI
jgi:hypothetical protein